MSSFPGQIQEYPLVSVDRFDGANLQSTCYFLSHNHSDHTIGLDQSHFHYRLASNCQYKLYCSVVTKSLLLLDDRYKPLAKSIVAVEINQPLQVPIYDAETGKVSENVTVTFLKAEHCPGSVMILFEGSEGTVLYTGDFRLDKSDLISMEYLHSGSRVKDIKSLYVDTTFCVPQALFIPSRLQSNAATIDIVKEWISQSKNHMVFVKHKAILGYEDLFRCLSQQFNMKVHVSAEKYAMYKNVGDMADYTTPHPSETQIHACRWTANRDSKSPLPCGHLPDDKSAILLRKIEVSTMYFLHRVSLDVFARRFSDTYFRVCYSFHSSYSEIRDMVLYLQPKRALPNVIPIGETMEMVQSRVSQFVETARRSILHSSPDQYKALGTLKVRARKRKQPNLSQKSNESSELLFGDLGVSPVKSRRRRHKAEQNAEQQSSSKVEFPALHGTMDTDSAEPSQESKASEINQNNEDSEEPYSSGAETVEGKDEDSETESGWELKLRLSMSQGDKSSLEVYTPLLREDYGDCLGYYSSVEESDSEEQTSVPDCTKSKVPDDDKSASASAALPSASQHQPKTQENIASSEVEQHSPNSKTLTAEEKKKSEEQAPTSGDVVVLGEDGSESEGEGEDDSEMTEESSVSNEVHSTESGATDDEQSEEDDNKNAGPDAAVKVTCEEKATNVNGHGKVEEKVLGTIDLTDLDEDDDVYPTTSNGQPKLFGCGSHDNIFSRMGLDDIQRAHLYNSIRDYGDIEYEQKEVPCSDEECECGGKAKGGTHKYMVPKQKYAQFEHINWEQQARLFDDEASLEPSQLRTRKWIESQVRFTQRQNFLNSQPVSNSDIIVINSESEEEEEVTEVDTQPVDDTTNHSGRAAEDNNAAANQAATTSTTAKEVPVGGLVKDVSPKPQVSPGSDRSATLTSCPTNLSVLAQPSEPSMKSVLTDTGHGPKLINGTKFDQTEANEQISKVPSECTGDKETGSS